MCRLAQGNTADNLKRETFEGCDFWGMIRQQLYPTQSQVMKDLRAHAIIPHQSITRFQTRLSLADILLLH